MKNTGYIQSAIEDAKAPGWELALDDVFGTPPALTITERDILDESGTVVIWRYHFQITMNEPLQIVELTGGEFEFPDGEIYPIPQEVLAAHSVLDCVRIGNFFIHHGD
jgi:hypothetical protein